jgi:hypothetical protein
VLLARWQQGLSDARSTLQVSPWLVPKPREVGVHIFDATHDMVTEDARLAS